MSKKNYNVLQSGYESELGIICISISSKLFIFPIIISNSTAVRSVDKERNGYGNIMV